MSNDKPAVLLLSSSTELRDSLHLILDNDFKVVESTSLDQGFSKIEEFKAQVCIYDCASNTDGKWLEELRSSYPQIPFIIVCPREKRDELLASKVANSAFRVLFSPLAPGQTGLAVSAAYKHAEGYITRSKENPVDSKAKKSSSLTPAIATVALLAVAGLSWFLVSNKNSEISEQGLISLSKQTDVAKLVNVALAAKTNNNLYPPAQNNALDIFLRVLELEPNNREALKGLGDLSVLALEGFDQHIIDGNIDEAIAIVGSARDIATTNEIFPNMVENLLEEKKQFNFLALQNLVADNKIEDAAAAMEVFVELFSDDDDEVFELTEEIEEKRKRL